MTVPQISLRQANRYVLRRQHLLRPCSDPVTAVEDACGLQAQIPSTPALSLRARVAGFAPADYQRLIAEERTLVRTWAMRGTVHVVPAASLPVYTMVYASPDRLPPGAQMAVELLRKGPASRQELLQRAVAEYGISRERARELFGPWGGVLRVLARAGLTVHTPNDGPDVRVALVEQWLGSQPPSPAMEELEDRLLQAYAHGYAPITMHDFAHFTSFRMGRVRAIFERATNLVEVRVEGSTRPHYIPEEDLAELLATTGDEEVPTILLPRFDSLLLAHRDKQRLLNEEDRPSVFRPAAVVEATALIDGRVAGTWRIQRTSRTLRFWFSPFRRCRTSAVRAAARRLARWYGLEELEFTVAK